MMQEKVIKNLGILQGKLLFFGGVYSNLQALQALKKWAGENDYSSSNIFCTGDILGYCAQPVECIELIREWGIHAIAGNVEIQVRNGEADCGCDFKNGGRCDLFSRNWYAYLHSKMNTETIEWLHSLPHHLQFNYGSKKFTIVHGSWFHISEFIFKSTPWSIKEKNFNATGSEVIVGGHCGLPFADRLNDKLWINPGVIGMPANDGTDKVWFVTVEQRKGSEISYQFLNYHYDNIEASKRMRQCGLPETYADTLITGLWDNCEILPPSETEQQGRPIDNVKIDIIPRSQGSP